MSIEKKVETKMQVKPRMELPQDERLSAVVMMHVSNLYLQRNLTHTVYTNDTLSQQARGASDATKDLDKAMNERIHQIKTIYGTVSNMPDNRTTTLKGNYLFWIFVSLITFGALGYVYYNQIAFERLTASMGPYAGQIVVAILLMIGIVLFLIFRRRKKVA